MGKDEKKDFFISYNKEDKAWAKWVEYILHENGYTSYIQARNIRPGDDFIDKMDYFLENSKSFIPIVSRHYFDSAYCKSEWTAAFNKNKQNKSYKFLPIRVADVKPPDLITTIVYIDIFDIKEEGKAITQILNAVNPNPIPRKPVLFPPSMKQETSAQPLFPGFFPKNNLKPRNKDFTGRENELAKICEAFTTASSIAINQTIAGLGGVGKTQLALEYAYRYGNQYKDTIWWVDAEKPSEVKEGLFKFANRFGLFPEGKDNARHLSDEEVLDRLSDWFNTHDSFLIIFDNVEESEDVADFLALLTNGHALITTLNRRLKLSKTRPIDLNIFTVEEACLFIQERLPKHVVIDEAVLKELVERLGRLPLALEQAAAYIEEEDNNCDCVSYLKMLKDHGLKLLDDAQPTDYHTIISTTWMVSIEKMDEGATQMLYMCAFMGPDNIPIDFFIRQRALLPVPLYEELEDELKQRRLIRELTKFSLVKREGDFLSLHRLVQEVVRQHKPSDGFDLLGCCFEAIMNDVRVEFTDYASRQQFAQIADHALMVAGYAEDSFKENDEKLEQVAILYRWIGLRNCKIVRFLPALTAHEKSCTLTKKNFGKNHKNTALCYGDIGNTYITQGDYKRALEWFLKSLEIRETISDANNPDIATTYNNIGIIYNELCDYDEALKWHLKSLEIRENINGKEHIANAKSYNNIGSVYLNKNIYDKASEFLVNALNIKEKNLSMNHPSTAITLNNLAGVHVKQGLYDKAYDGYHKALEITESVLGTIHTDTALRYVNIGNFYYSQEKYNEALSYNLKAYQIIIKIFDVNHPKSLKYYNDLQLTYNATGLPQPFDQWLKEALTRNKI